MSRPLSLKHRLMLLAAAALAGMLSVGAYGVWSQRQASHEERAVLLRSMVESAQSGIAHYVELEKQGKLARPEAQARAKEALRNVRYQEREYFFIYTFEGVNVLLPTAPQKEGTAMIDAVDKRGNRFIRDITAAGKAGGGFVDYYFPRPKETEAVSKKAYVLGVPDWQWVVGTGLYMDDVEAAFLRKLAAFAAVALALASLVFALVVLTGRRIVAQLGGEPAYAAEAVRRVAAGDLVTPIDLRPGDGTSLLAAMREMQERLRRTVGEIQQATDSISTGTAQIAAGNLDLSQRTEEQAASLEETAASMHTLTDTVTGNTANAEQANALASQASGVATEGGQVVREVVETMSAINVSSRKIRDIIGVIDGIAFQTNILALNAAVEAARAGEQGRGFAVVASEVRNLATRSAAAASEIKGLIDESVRTVEDGTQLVGRAGQTMEGIVSAVNRVTGIVQAIAADSRAQGDGIAQVNEAVKQMDQVTQANAGLVEEAAAAAQSLEEQARRLARSVSVFRVEAGTPLAA